MLTKFKEALKKKNNKNYTFVKTRSLHSCSHCLTSIKSGTECLTVNTKLQSRRWYCDDCVKLFLELAKAKSMRDSVNFGDEGGYMACDDWVNECIDAIEQARGNN